MIVGYQLGVREQMYWVPVFLVACPLTIILRVSAVLIVECWFWFAIVARYVTLVSLVRFNSLTYLLCASVFLALSS